MTHEQFIATLAPLAQKWAKYFKFGVPSVVIAQGILESGWGNPANPKVQHHNYFGLKYRANRVECNSGYFTDGGAQQLANGAYIPISTDWYSFANMDMGVKGYFEFIKNGPYAAARAVAQDDFKGYLAALKACGYATSLSYVDNITRVINQYSLTKYDNLEKVEQVKKTATTTTKKEETKLQIHTHNNSTYHNTSVRYGKIEYIVCHYTADLGTAANHITAFSRTSMQSASADFFVDELGIWQYNMNIKGRYSWAVGGGRQSGYGGAYFNKCTNPNSVSIEMCVKSNGGSLAANGNGWYFDPKTIDNAVELVKYLMKELNLPASRVIRHYDVTGKYCPGVRGWNTAAGNTEQKWIAFKKRIGDGSASAVSSNSSSASSTASKTNLYRVRKTWGDANSQIGAYSILENAINEVKKAGSAYKVFDWNGKQVYPEVKKPATSAAAQMYRVRKTWADAESQIGAYRVLANAKIKADENPGYYVFNSKGAIVYPTTSKEKTVNYLIKVSISNAVGIYGEPNKSFKTYCPIGGFTIVKEKDGWGKLKSGAGWIDLSKVTKI